MPKRVFAGQRYACDRCTHSQLLYQWSDQEAWMNVTCPQCEEGWLIPESLALQRVRGVVPDDIPGGLVMNHVCPGRKVYSRTELNQVLAENGGWRVSDYGWTGETEQVFTKSQRWADLRTKAQRIQEMADFLGWPVEHYLATFYPGLDTGAISMP